MSFKYCLLFLSLVAVSVAERCRNPRVTQTSYTTPDATVLRSVAYIAEFTLVCDNGVKDVPLYALLDGKVSPVARVMDDSASNKYQVSWTKEVPQAYAGEHVVPLYDEEGYVALRKAQRSGETSGVEPLVTVSVHHPGTYTGPWLSSEFMAVVLATCVSYIALSQRSKLIK